eukprot:15217648-Ditylum_brightwellii.AAC.1
MKKFKLNNPSITYATDAEIALSITMMFSPIPKKPAAVSDNASKTRNDVDSKKVKRNGAIDCERVKSNEAVKSSEAPRKKQKQDIVFWRETCNVFVPTMQILDIKYKGSSIDKNTCPQNYCQKRDQGYNSNCMG